MAEEPDDPRSIGFDQPAQTWLETVPELCQNPVALQCQELLFEREQLPQVVDIKHLRME